MQLKHQYLLSIHKLMTIAQQPQLEIDDCTITNLQEFLSFEHFLRKVGLVAAKLLDGLVP